MKENKTALYHRIMRRESFEKAAKDLFQLLVLAQNKTPDTPRILYVDIDGHRNENGGFDSDMLELQKEFGLGFLLPYFTEVHFPLVTKKNTKPQRNDIPDKLEIYNAGDRKDDRLRELCIENYSNRVRIGGKCPRLFAESVRFFAEILRNGHGLRADGTGTLRSARLPANVARVYEGSDR